MAEKNTSQSVLMIEDNQGFIRLVEFALVRMKLKLVARPDANDIVEVVKETRPVAILLDIMLPGIDGWQAVDLIRNNDELKDIPIIAMSATDINLETEKLVRARFAGFLKKPFLPQQLTHLLKFTLSQN